MNIERMKLLRQMLVDMQSNPLIDDLGRPVQFDMANYFDRIGRQYTDEHPCGTACCMAGSMPFYPAFKELGLVACPVDGFEWLDPITFVNGREMSAHDAAATLLEIDDSQATKLFTSYHYPSDDVRDMEQNWDPVPLSAMTLEQAITRVDRMLADPDRFVP